MTEIAFIDQTVSGLGTLLAGLRPDVEAVVLDASTPASTQIARALGDRIDIRAIHIVAHGSPGEVSFGAGALALANLDEAAADLAAIGRALGTGGELRLWSCRTGAGEQGAAFVETLAGAAGAEVAAASGLVGAAHLGGRWELAGRSGGVADSAAAPLTDHGIASYMGVMSYSVTLPSISSVGSDNIVNSTEAGSSGFKVIGSATWLAGGTGSGGDLSIGGSPGSTSSSPSVGDAFSLTLTFTDNSGHTKTYSGNATVTAVSQTNVTWSFTVTSFSSSTIVEGSNVHVRATVGSSPSSQFNFEYDKTAPSAPSIAQVTDDASPTTGTVASGGSTNDTTPTVRVSLSGTGAATGDSVQLYNGSSALGSAVTLTASNITAGYVDITTSALSNGTSYSFKAKITDEAGNTGSASSGYAVTVDTTAPSAPAITQVSDDASPTTGTVASGGSTNDTTPTVRVSLSGTGAAAGDSVQLYNGASALGSAATLTAADISAGYVDITTSALGSGTYNLNAKVTDAAGNAGSASSSYAVTVDTTAPSVPTISQVFDNVSPTTGTVASGGSTNDTTPTVRVSLSGTGAAAGDSVQLYNGASALGSAVTLTASNITVGIVDITTSALSNATYSFNARITDAVGNTSSASSSYAVTVNIAAPGAPSIFQVSDNVSPTTGTVTSGGSTNDTTPTVRVSLSGTGAVAGDSVQLYNFASALGSAAVLSASDITAGYKDVTTSALSDGFYNLTAKVTDAAGNASAASGSYAVTVDTTAPSAPTISQVSDDASPLTGTVASGGSTNDTTPTVRVSLSGTGAAAGDSVQLYNGASALGSAVTLSASDIAAGYKDVTTSALSDGTYSFNAKVTDAAGNTGSASSSFAVTVDTTAPGAPSITQVSDDTSPLTGTVANGGSTNDTTPTVRVSVSGTGAVAGDSVQLYNGVSALGSATTLTSTNIGAGYVDITTPALSEGFYDFNPRITDAAGNVGITSNSYAVTVDTTAPGAPIITQMSDDASPMTGTVLSGGSTNDTTPTVRVSLNGTGATAGGSVQLYNGASALGSAVVLSASDITTGYKDVTTSALSGGTYNLNAKVTDAAGNASIASNNFAVTVDITAPSAPTIPQVSDDVSPLTGTVASGGSTNDTTPTVWVTLIGTGAAAGNSVQLYNGASALGSAVTLTASNITVEVVDITTSALGDGAYAFNARVIDAAGNVGAASSSYAVTVDTSAPGAPSITQVSDDVSPLTGTVTSGGSTNDTTPTVRVSVSGTGAAAGDSVQLYNGASALGSAVALSASDIAAGYKDITTSALSDGSYSLNARITDTAGNAGNASSSHAVTVDTTAPGAPTISQVNDDVSPTTGTVADGGSTNDATPTVRVSLSGTGAAAGDSVQLYNGASALGSAVVLSALDIDAGSLDITTSSLGDAAYAFNARITDAVGNASGASASYAVTINTAPTGAPTITDVSDDASPVTGTVANGGSTNDATPTVRVSLSGTGAAADDSVQLYDGGSALGSAVVLTAPDISAGFVDITTPALSNGTHELTAKVIDDLGGSTDASATWRVSIDTTVAAPNTPALVFSSDSGPSDSDNITNVTTAFFVGDGAENGATVTLYDSDGTTVLATTIASEVGNWGILDVPLDEGVHTLTVKQTDLAGNVSDASAPLVVTVDTTAPATPTIAGFADDSGVQGDFVTNDRTITLTGTAEADSTVTLLDGASHLANTTADGDGNWSFTTEAYSDSSHSFTAYATDAAGNVSDASSALAVTIDGGVSEPFAPVLVSTSDSGTSDTDRLTNITTPTLAGSGLEPGATVTLYDDFGATVLGTGTVDAVGEYQIVSAALADGEHFFTIGQTDLAGNTRNGLESLSVTIDTTVSAPNAPALVFSSDSGSSDSDNITNVTTPFIIGNGVEPGATVTLYDSDGTTVLGVTIAVGNGTWGISDVPLGGGTHTLTASQTDIAGNTSDVSAALVLTIDTTAPATPTITTFADDTGVQGDFLTNDRTITLTGTAEANSTVTLLDDGNHLATTTADGDGNWSFTTEAYSDSSHSFTAYATDAAGNVSGTSSALDVTIDGAISEPGEPALAAGSDSGVSDTDRLTNVTTPTVFGGGLEPGAAVKLYDTDGTTVLGTTTADAAGDYTIVSSTLADGEHALTIEQTDAAGNVRVGVAALHLTIDTTVAAPNAPELDFGMDGGPSDSDNITNVTTPIIRGDGADEGATVTLYDSDGTTVLGTAVADALGIWAIPDVPLSEGTHTLTVKQTDLAGNTSDPSAQLVVTIDARAAAPGAPALAIASESGPSNSDNITNVATPTVAGSGAEQGATVTLYDTDGMTVLGTTTADAEGDWQIVSSALGDGAHSLTVRQADLAGNTSDASAALVVTIDTTVAAPDAPALAAASDSGALDNVTNVTTPTVSGGGAEAGATVTLYDTDGTTIVGAATADAGGDWQIASVPLGDGPHSLTVRQTDLAGNISAASAPLVVTIDTTAAATDAPVLAVASDSGAADNITSVTTPTVAGSGAEQGATVTLYDTDGTTVLGMTTAGAGGDWEILSSALGDGAHSLTVRQTDTAGNLSDASAALNVVIDTTVAALSAPDLATAFDSGASDADDRTNAAPPVFFGTGAEEGATVTLYDTDGTTVLGTTTANEAGNWAIISATLGDGSHSLTVRQTDLAGNSSASSAGLTVTIDTTAPSAPSISQVIDDVAPTTGTVADGGSTNDVTPTVRVSLSGTGAASGDSVQLYNGSSALGSAVTLSAANISAGYADITTSALSEGTYGFNAVITDAAGNVGSASSSHVVTVDTSTPSAPTISQVSDDVSPATGTVASGGDTNDTTPTVRVSLSGTGAAAGDSVQLYNGSSALGSAVTLTSSDITADYKDITTSVLSNGSTYSFNAKITDAAGNTSGASGTYAVTVDATAPSAPSISQVIDNVAPTTGTVANGGTTNDDTPTVRVSLGGTGAAAGDSVQLYNGSSALGSAVALSASDITAGYKDITTSALSEGSYGFNARITDAAGNTGSASSSYAVTVNSVNDRPVGITDVASVVEDASFLIDVLANDFDVDGDTLSIASLSGTKSALGASIAIVGGQIRYTADADSFDLATFTGTIDTFTYIARDPGGLLTDPVTVQVTVSPANDSRTLNGTNRSDRFTDASGFDTTYFAKNGNDIVSGQDGSDVLHGQDGEDQLFGGAGIDFLHGGKDEDKLDGGDGNDQLFGGDDEDQLLGGAGNDSLSGERGDDNLNGGDGNDTLAGGQGNDRMQGASGSDTFRLEQNLGKDTVVDFVVGVDHLQLSGLTVKSVTTANVDRRGPLDTVVTFNEGGSVSLLGVNGVTDWHVLL